MGEDVSNLEEVRNILRIIKNSNTTWVDFNRKLKLKSKQLDIEPLVYYKAENPGPSYSKILNGTTNKIKDFDLADFIKVGNAVLNDLNLNNDYKEVRKFHSKEHKIIRAAFHTFPDTRLLYYFRYSFPEYLEFVKIPGWDSSINLFEENDTDIHLHTFSQAVILEKILQKEFIFIPLFHFQGYGVVIKKERIDFKKTKENDFFTRTKGYTLRDYILNEEYKIIVEKNSDFHWMQKKFFKKKIGSRTFSKIIEESPEKLNFDKKIISMETNHGKQEFISKDEAIFYFTNWVHYESLETSYKDKYRIISHDEFSLHKNVNGLIMLKEFYDENEIAVEAILNGWFKSMNILQAEFRSEKKNSKIHIKNSHIYNYCQNINSEFGLSISPEELQNRFDTNNKFYKDLQESIYSYTSIIEKNLSSYKELSELNNLGINDEGVEITQEDLDRVIERSKEIIKKIK